MHILGAPACLQNSAQFLLLNRLTAVDAYLRQRMRSVKRAVDANLRRRYSSHFIYLEAAVSLLGNIQQLFYLLYSHVSLFSNRF